MADPLHARDLIVEDALQSRGLILGDEALIEQERELDDDLRKKKDEDHGSTLYKVTSGSSSGSSGAATGKGKARSHAGPRSGYDVDSDNGNGRGTAPKLSNTQRGKQRALNGYDAMNGGYNDDADESSSSRAAHRSDKRRHRQPHSASTPSTTTHPQRSAYDSSPNNNYDEDNVYSHTNHSIDEDNEANHASPQARRVQYRQETRATDRLLGSILARDPMKELESDSTGSQKKSLTKEEVRAAYWKSIFISCLFVLAWWVAVPL